MVLLSKVPWRWGRLPPELTLRASWKSAGCSCIRRTDRARLMTEKLGIVWEIVPRSWEPKAFGTLDTLLALKAWHKAVGAPEF